MGIDIQSLESSLQSLDARVAGVRPRAGGAAGAIDRWRGDLAAALFHLGRRDQRPLLLCILGGTGTGKSTVVNRLLEANLSAASFRRTFTAGAVAIAGPSSVVPQSWLGVPHQIAQAQELPARGRGDALLIVRADHALLNQVVLVDTPDLDGDQPIHHAQADRVFRWSEGIIFLVSPEKYQMTELLPYYRLARRYAVPALFVMNKCETREMLEDYRKLIEANGQPGVGDTSGAIFLFPLSPCTQGEGWGEGQFELKTQLDTQNHPHPKYKERGQEKNDPPPVGSRIRQPASLYAIARDDAAYEPPAENNLAALRDAIGSLARPEPARRAAGARVRAVDLLGRLRDQITAPLRGQRADVDAAAVALRALETPPPGVDVNPLTEQLERRLQQRSVLYLIGPGRVLDRVRQMPAMLVRLPRTAWDLVLHGKTNIPSDSGETRQSRALPDFKAALIDQFTILQSRIEDVLRSTTAGRKWVDDPAQGYADCKIAPAEAGRIVEEELNELSAWLTQRWNATPRDTVLLMKILRRLPGGEKLTQWTEAAPYLLAIIVAAHHAIFGHIDLMILGGYSVATWLTERLSNEVAARARQTNRAIAVRFEKLAHEQIRRGIGWIESKVPPAEELRRIESAANALEELISGNP